MRNLRPVLLILLSLLIGAIAVALAVRWIGLRTEVATTKVVVASRDLVFGTQLKEGMLEVIDWPATGALKDPVSDRRPRRKGWSICIAARRFSGCNSSSQ